jgi:hypothetical protein
MAKNPQINSFTNIRGIDGEVQKIQNLMSFSWLDNAFGMAELSTSDKGVVPVFFNTNQSDPQNLAPNDRWVDYCFWTYSTPGTVRYSEGQESMIMRKGKTYITYAVSCIFFMKLPTTALYKVTKTQRRQEVIEFFDTLIGYPGVVAPTEWIDHTMEAVFEGFDIQDLAKWSKLPYYGLRVNMDITYRNYCA